MSHAGPNTQLKPHFVRTSELGEQVRSKMFNLLSASFDCVDRYQFDKDLNEKNEVLLLSSDSGKLRGFSTLQFWDEDFEGEPLRILFSGDTIIDSKHWGTQSLAFSWIQRAGSLKLDAPHRRLFWFLIVKGHRTYRYLPTFAVKFHPDWRSAEDAWLKRLADHLASSKFGSQYNQDLGVIHFNSSKGQLVPELAEPRPCESSRPEVEYFLKRNPGYREGDELVCVCELAESNLRPIARRVFRRGTAS